MHASMGPLVLFAAVMCLTPGPNVIMVTASAANFGFRRAIPHMLGTDCRCARSSLLGIGHDLGRLWHDDRALPAQSAHPSGLQLVNFWLAGALLDTGVLVTGGIHQGPDI
jgi:hypothetical protein